MTNFTYHPKDTAPAESAPLIDASTKAYGFHPKRHQIMAAAPVTYRAYLETFRIFAEETTLSPLEQQVVMQTANYENHCHYCTAGYSMLMKMIGADAALQRLLDAGYDQRQSLEVLTGLATKLLSNFTNALAHTDLDAPVEPFAWIHPDDRAARGAPPPERTSPCYAAPS